MLKSFMKACHAYVALKLKQPSTWAGVATIAKTIESAGGLTPMAVPLVLAGIGAILAN